MSLQNDVTVTTEDDVEQLLNEEEIETTGANSNDGTSNVNKNEILNTNNISLNEALSLLQRALNIQQQVPSTVDTTENTNPAPRPVVNTVDPTANTATGEEEEMLHEVSQEFGKTDIKGPPINEKLTKIFQDLTFGICKEEKLEKLLNDLAPQKILKDWKTIKLIGKFGGK